MKKLIVAAACMMMAGVAVCGKNTVAGTRAEALPDSLWQHSQWIAAADAPVVHGKVTYQSVRAADGASWFVADVRAPRKVKRAVWMTTGLGVYQLYVNGHKIGAEVLKPGFTHPGKTKRSFTYDVTDAFVRRAGAVNRLAVQSTPGWWADKIVTPAGNDGMVGRKPAFRGVLELTYDDGTRQYFGTNTTDWKAGVAGPVTHAGIYDGEEYDARRPQGYAVADKLGKPEVSEDFKGEILPSAGAEIYLRHDLTLQPAEAYKYRDVSGATDNAYGTVVKSQSYKPGQTITLEPGETLVVDFGQNCAAVPEFVFSAKEGTTLTYLPAEILNDGNGAHSRGMDGPEGSCHRRNLRIGDQGIRLRYTFGPDAAGGKFVSYRPECTFFGYRYASVTADGPVTIKSLTSVPVTSIAADMETGKIETGNADINKLIQNTVWSMRSNYLSVPTDCPQRDERLGWTADTQVFSETGTYFANTQPFFHKWTRDLRDTQSPLGGYPGVAPWAQYGGTEGDMMRLGWSDAGVIVPWVIWKQYGDTAIVAENWAAMERYMDHVNATRYDHHVLSAENGDYQWADWLSYEDLESCSGLHQAKDADGKKHIRPEAYDYWNYLSANYWLSNARMMADMARATGRDAAKYDAMADEAARYIRGTFFNDKGEFRTAMLNDMQTPNLFALRNRLFDGAVKDAIIKRLRNNFADHGNCLQTGFLGTSILMPTLTENGMSDIAYELLLQHRNPSWLYSVDNGATTIWERWNSYMLDKGMGPRGMNSFNHYAYGCVCEWMWKTMAGIAADTAEPGFTRIIMKPVPDRRLGFVKAEYQSAAGPVTSHWRYEGDKWIWDFSVPEGATASVTLPGSATARTYGPGPHHIEL